MSVSFQGTHSPVSGSCVHRYSFVSQSDSGGGCTDFGLATKSRFRDRSGWFVANVPSYVENGIGMFDLQAAKAKYSRSISMVSAEGLEFWGAAG